jgi:hypothetical protein
MAKTQIQASVRLQWESSHRHEAFKIRAMAEFPSTFREKK